MTVVYKKIKYPEDPKLGKKASIEEFVSACNEKWSDQSFTEKKIDTKEPPNHQFAELDETLITPENLSFEITNADIKKIAEQLISITTNPTIVAESLKDLDEALGSVMKENGMEFDENDLPEFLIAGKGHYIPGPPPHHYHPKKKARLLDTLLSERERKNKINVENASPKFVGPIDSKQANPFVALGHIFTEDKQVSRLLQHGSLSHRIMFDAIWRAKESGRLDLTYGDGKELTPQQLLELLVYTQYYRIEKDKLLHQNGMNLWEMTLDVVTDSVHAPHAAENYLNENHYSFSCRSPYVFNSLLLNFGKELKLPNLQYYLLDSHWKAAYEMVYRVKKAMTSTAVADSTIYTYCMEAMTTAVDDNLGEIGVKLPFTLTGSEAQQDPSYVPFDSTKPIAGIVKKNKKPTRVGTYASWQDFFDHLKPQATDDKSKVNPADQMKPISRTISDQQTRSTASEFKAVSVDQTRSISKTITDQPTYSLDNSNEIKELLNGKNQIIEQVILDKFTEMSVSLRGMNIKELVELIPSEQHQKLLEMLGSKRLFKLIEFGFRLRDLFKLLSTPNQSLLIKSLGSEHLQKITKTLPIFIEMLCNLNPESRSILFQVLDENTIIKIFIHPEFLVESINKLQSENRNDVVTDLFNFVFSISIKELVTTDHRIQKYLSILASKLKPEELKNAKLKLMQDAFQENNKNLCEKLIHSGSDFYACNVNPADEESCVLFNDLCEAQAKFNVEKLEREIFSIDWEMTFTGNPIRNCNHPNGKKVPGTVESEFKEIEAAERSEKTYYSAWKKTIELRQEAAKHNEDWVTFFRNRKDPAKKHYKQADDETPILPLKLKISA